MFFDIICISYASINQGNIQKYSIFERVFEHTEKAHIFWEIIQFRVRGEPNKIIN